MLELLLFALIGIGLGIFTGLMPGIHVNAVGLLFLGLGSAINPYNTAVAIMALAISHTIFDFIPSIFLGAPDPETSLSVLPGHRLLLQGRGLEAIHLTITGSVCAALAAALIFPLMLFSIPWFYGLVQGGIHYILLLIAGTMILTERGMQQKAAALLVFLLSGTLGYILLNSSLLPQHFLLFPIFTGLFGLSSLIISLKTRPAIPKQAAGNIRIPKKLALSGTLKGLFSGVLVGTLPGVGGAEATLVTQQLTRGSRKDREFLVSLGAINTIVALFSIVALFTISKPRSGAAVYIQQVLPSFGLRELFIMLSVTLLATGLSAIIALKLVKSVAMKLQEIDYARLNLFTILFLAALTAFLTGFLGLLILAVSTAIGITAILMGVKRGNLMGILMLPIIIFYASL
ncbi:MAG: tripartite tricarboxylate transporter permease [Candidatus Aenigmarchaeota archaeon]|nr:tripartite tricarboxylate transporter permease [Candidatus Aenigmarchaeota archaeon]